MFQVKTYANKEGKAMDPPQQNRVQVIMARSEAESLAERDKDMVKDFFVALKDALAK